jgi:hypothetical protein
VDLHPIEVETVARWADLPKGNKVDQVVQAEHHPTDLKGRIC